MSTTRHRFVSFALLLFLSSLLAACGDNGATQYAPNPVAGATATTASSGGNGEITVSLAEYSISPATINVAAGHVKFKLINAGTFPHNFGVVVNGKDMKSSDVAPGGTGSLELDLTPGTYDTLCDLPTHKQKGMAGTIVVK
jgi:uncharacterized cupredoxin-like copper-binding protein